MKAILKVGCLLALLSCPAFAGPPVINGRWLVKSDNAAAGLSEIDLYGASFTILHIESAGAGFGDGWWSELGERNGRIPVRVTVTDNPPDNVEYEFKGPNRVEVYDGQTHAHVATMTRTTCDMSMQFLDKATQPPPGCYLFQIKGYGYDGLTGDCEFHDDWVEQTPEMERAPMACLVQGPAEFANY